MKKSKVIMLMGQDDLLSYSVDLFLTTHKEWHVVNMSFEQNLDTLFQMVAKVNPDVVIIQQGGDSCYSSLPVSLLQDNPSLKVITLNLNDNFMEVYSKQNILVGSSTDLFSVIETQTRT